MLPKVSPHFDLNYIINKQDFEYCLEIEFLLKEKQEFMHQYALTQYNVPNVPSDIGMQTDTYYHHRDLHYLEIAHKENQNDLSRPTLFEEKDCIDIYYKYPNNRWKESYLQSQRHTLGLKSFWDVLVEFYREIRRDYSIISREDIYLSYQIEILKKKISNTKEVRSIWAFEGTQEEDSELKEELFKLHEKADILIHEFSLAVKILESSLLDIQINRMKEESEAKNKISPFVAIGMHSLGTTNGYEFRATR